MKSASGSRGTGSAGRRSGRPKPACPAIKRRLKTAYLGATMNRLLVAASRQSAAGWLLPRTAALCRDAATQVHGHNARSQNRGGSFHEPESGLPAIQRLTQTRFMAPTHVRILEVFALHEPPLTHPSPPRRERVAGGRVRGGSVKIRGVLCLLFLCALALTGRAADSRPNILLCIADDASWGHFGANGDTVCRTPTFDRVAREGVNFSHAFCTSASCT